MARYGVHAALAPVATLLRSVITTTGVGLALWEWRGSGTVSYHRPDHHTISLYLRGGNFVRRVDRSDADNIYCGASRQANSTGSPGAVCVIPRETETSWGNRGYVRWLHVYFQDRHLEVASAGIASVPPSITFGCDPTLRELAERFLLALDWDVPDDRVALNHAISAFLARSLKIEKTTSDFRAPGGGLTGAQRRAIEDVFATTLKDRIVVADLAEAAGLSVRHFSRAFAASYDMAPYEWVLRQRVYAAQEMLSEGCDARDVAAACGFSSQSHMIRRFRATFGYTPGALR